MKKKIGTLIGILVLTMNAALAFNPGIHYYSNEETKAMAYAGRINVQAKAMKRLDRAARKHLKQTSRTKKHALKQEYIYNRMLLAENNVARHEIKIERYPQEFYTTKDTDARLYSER
jgi:hypothetical protein